MEAIKANEINEIIRAQIENFDASMTVDEVGTVIKVGDGIAEIYGLEKVMAGELLDFDSIRFLLRTVGIHPTAERADLPRLNHNRPTPLK